MTSVVAIRMHHSDLLQEHKWPTALQLPPGSTVTLAWGHALCGLPSARLSTGMVRRQAHSGETQDYHGWLVQSPHHPPGWTWPATVLQSQAPLAQCSPLLFSSHTHQICCCVLKMLPNFSGCHPENIPWIANPILTFAPEQTQINITSNQGEVWLQTWEVFASVHCDSEVLVSQSSGHLLASGLPWQLRALGKLVKSEQSEICFFSLVLFFCFLEQL